MVYQFVEKIGQGGFGTVDKVIGPDGFPYARKTLVVPHQLDTAAVKPRFEREVKYQGAITHPNVVQIVAHNLSDDPPWFVMHLAECSLQDELIIDRTLGGSPKSALFHILSGLEEIHRLGYCHRDLKPGNVLKFLSADGISWYALSDFGLMAVGEDASSTLTPSGIGGGTPLYQAPECAINFKRATPRSDIYSFGAMLYDIFAVNPKRLPHEELSVLGAIGPVIEKCTKKNPHRRFKNVEQLREALFGALDVYQFVPSSGEEAKVLELLANENELPTAEQWDDIFDFLDVTPDVSQPTKNIYQALRLDHIQQLGQDDPDLLAALGSMFATHCRTRSFSFDYTDVLAAKAQLFYDMGDLSLKAYIAIAMLILGLDHNRWFVERKFLRMVGPDISEELAKRITVELSVLKIDFPLRFAQMEQSITVTSAALHPQLIMLLL